MRVEAVFILLFGSVLGLSVWAVTEHRDREYTDTYTRGAALGYFEAQSILSLRLITYFHLLTEAVKTKL